MMGKIHNNSAVEIIPLDDINSENTPPRLAAQKQRSKMYHVPYLSDPTIVPRVQKYLESNVDKTYVDINVMADELQRTYREYARRKRSAFRQSVKKAYSVVLQSYNLGGQQSSSEVESDASGGDVEEGFHENSLSSQLLEMYSRPKPLPVNDSELIDISSDDSEEVNTTNNQNGASTSRKPVSNESSPRPEVVEQEAETSGYVNKRPAKMASSTPFPDRGKKRKLDKDLATSATTVIVTKKRKAISTSQPQQSTVTFKDIGGLDNVLEDVVKLLVHIKHPEVYRQIGISPPRGFLLHGPPGCGKTLLANAIAGELNVPLMKVAAPELVAGVSGESESRIRELFEWAIASAPCVLFIDEIDSITPNRQNAQKEMERRIVAQLLSCLDDLNKNEQGDQILVIGATNRPDSIDPALRRAGRFDREVSLGIPNLQARLQILKVTTSTLKIAEGVDFNIIAKNSPGFVGADLAALTREAALAAVSRVFNDLKQEHKTRLETTTSNDDTVAVAVQANKSEEEIIVDDVPKETQPPVASTSGVVVIDDESKSSPIEKQSKTFLSTADVTVDEPLIFQEKESVAPKTLLEELTSWLHDKNPVTPQHLANLCVTMEDFEKALKCVQPSAKREGFATVPDVTWDDVGSLQDVREELKLAILAPVQHAEQFEALGINTPTGVLLCGPPGCGKTLLAKAVANEAGINFISVKGPELLNMYVGESERAVRTCFERARNSAPCVIFFDELDALCPKRSDSREGGATMRVVNQMLTEMDGLESRKDVFLLAASNRPDIIDPAVLRPGRLDKILYVGFPSPADRVDILRALTKNGTKPQLSPFVDLEAIGKSEECSGYTGADLAALIRETGVIALKEFLVSSSSGGAGDQLPLLVSAEHFKKALSKIRRSVSEKDQKHYEKLRRLYSAVPEEEEMEYS